MEEWRPLNCPGYESLYEVSDLGRLRSARTKRLRKFKHDDNGYVAVVLCKDGKQKNKRLHRLVALTFLANPEKLPEVNHIDHDKENCKATNLEWCVRQYNENQKVTHRKNNGTYRNSMAKLGHDQVKKAFELRSEGLLQREIAERLGVCRATVGYLLQRKTHSEVSI